MYHCIVLVNKFALRMPPGSRRSQPDAASVIRMLGEPGIRGLSKVFSKYRLGSAKKVLFAKYWWRVSKRLQVCRKRVSRVIHNLHLGNVFKVARFQYVSRVVVWGFASWNRKSCYVARKVRESPHGVLQVPLSLLYVSNACLFSWIVCGLVQWSFS